MRTTLVIEEDVHQSALALARESGKSLGDVISELARMGLQRRAEPGKMRNGILLLHREADGPIITSDTIRDLLHESELE